MRVPFFLLTIEKPWNSANVWHIFGTLESTCTRMDTPYHSSIRSEVLINESDAPVVLYPGSFTPAQPPPRIDSPPWNRESAVLIYELVGPEVFCFFVDLMSLDIGPKGSVIAGRGDG